MTDRKPPRGRSAAIADDWMPPKKLERRAVRAMAASATGDPETANGLLAPDVVAVPTRGVERWLAQRLSHRLGTAPGRGDGVCAGVDFRSPRSLFAVVSGADAKLIATPPPGIR